MKVAPPKFRLNEIMFSFVLNQNKVCLVSSHLYHLYIYIFLFVFVFIKAF